MTRAVVVGAGLAGLSAALRLRESGMEVLIVERSRLLGGKATSFVVDGVEVDNGQHVHLACCTEYIDFVADVGMGDHLWTQPRFEVTVLGRHAAPASLRASPWVPPRVALLPAFAAYHRLTAPAKLRLAVALGRLDAPVGAMETFGAWLRRHRQGADAVTAFWAPFVVPALNASLDEVAAADALFVLRTAFADPADARIGWSRVPLARIAAEAARRAGEVRLRTAVTGLLDDGDAIGGVTCADGSEIGADVVVLAVPPRRLASILGSPQRFGVMGLERFESRAIIDVHLVYDVATVGFDFAAIVDSPVQWVFQKSPGRLCCSLSAADDLLARSEAELVELCHRELAAAWPRLTAITPSAGAVTRDPEATFVPRPGLRRPGWRTNRANLAIAGAWTDTGWPATMESAVRSGRAAAHGMVVSTSTAPRAREAVYA